jgi:2-polyprenyl-3-methyl-5-hydroxy-6-metoxy-1,4-benzoquinol methylase
MNEIDIVREYYNEKTEGEWNRLNGFRFEYEITKIMLKRHMKPGKVLDIGGGPGRYSLYLASIGYDVTLVDLSENNVEFAKTRAKELGLSIKAYQCDARNLSKLNLETYDNILIMGPLYHIYKEEDRINVIKEAKKYINKNGHYFMTFLSEYAGINFYLSECPNDLIREKDSGYLECISKNKSWAGTAFTEAYFIETEEIESLANKCGLEKITLFGQEGIAATRLLDLEIAPEEIKEYWMKISLLLCENKKYYPYSSHLMYIGRNKS